MQTVIMAGGEGKRLRPLTCSLPKPLLPLLEKPIIEYILDLLTEHSISSAVITTGYLGEKIKRHFPSGKYKGIALEFSHEDLPLGTAGSVKKAVGDKREDTLVISGDALCDFDLSKAVNFHRKRRSAVTIIGKRVEDPREYGLIETDGSGRVLGFLEKPDYSKVSSDLANTGVYILSPKALSLIPKSGQPDFGRDIFPFLLKEGEEISVYEDEGYWCDIGSVKTYISCQHDILKGKVKCARGRELDCDNNLIKTPIPSGVKILPPVYIGENVVFGRGVTIDSGSVISSRSKILSGAKIKGGIVGEGAFLGERSSVSGSVISNGAILKRAASIYEEGAVGEKAVIGESAVVLPFIKIWPYKQVEDMTVQKENVKDGIVRRELFDDDGILGDTSQEITPEFLAIIGKSVGSIKRIARVFIGYDEGDASKAFALSLISGVLSVGKNVFCCEQISKAEFLWEIQKRKPDIGVYIFARRKTKIEFYHSDSLPISRETERRIEDGVLRNEYMGVSFNEFGSLNILKRDNGYYESLLKLSPEGLSGQKAKITSIGALEEKLREALKTLSAAEGGISFQLSSGGTKASAYSEETGYIPYEKLVAICCLDLFSKGEDAALPERMPRAIDELALVYDRRVLRYADLSVCSRDSEARSQASAQPFLRDGAKLIIAILSFFKRTGLDLKSALRLIPSFSVEVKTVKIPETVGAALSKFSGEEKRQTAEGICFSRENGTVFLKPMKKGREIKIYAESLSAEISKELAEDIEKILAGNLDIERKK